MLVLGCGYFLLSVALCQRFFRPRAKAAYSSRSRCCRSRSTVCLGDIRYDKNRIRSDPPLAECSVLYHTSLTPTYALTNNLSTICCALCSTVNNQHTCRSTHPSPPWSTHLVVESEASKLLLRQPEHEQDYHLDDYGYCQYVTQREPRTMVTTHSFSFRCWLLHPLDFFRHRTEH